MGVNERRRKYGYNRVMIETARILDPQFADAVIYLTGAQIEMLRNVTQYLNRLETYVTEYASGYYLTPTVEDYDTLLAIVADLEETLMGNPNTIWSYNDRHFQYLGNGDTAAGTITLIGSVVPAKEVWRIEGVRAYNAVSITPLIEIIARFAGQDTALARMVDVPIDTRLEWDGDLTLKEGDYLKVVFTGCTLHDFIAAPIRGYKMIVP